MEAREALIATAKKHRGKESGISTAWNLPKARSRTAEAGPVDIVTALHACDTATDEAIMFASEA